MLGNSAVVVVVVRTRPRAIRLAKITMRKSTHGFPLSFPCMMSMGLRLAALSGRRSSARKRRHNFADFFCRIHILSATLLICSQAEKIRDIMSLMAVFTREWVSSTDLSCFTDSLHNIHRRALLFIDNRQFVGFLHKQT